jgi:hypothetical protein
MRKGNLETKMTLENIVSLLEHAWEKYVWGAQCLPRTCYPYWDLLSFKNHFIKATNSSLIDHLSKPCSGPTLETGRWWLALHVLKFVVT